MVAIENLSDPACEVLWRLRADNVISKEDYEVIRDALYKLANIEEYPKTKNNEPHWVRCFLDKMTIEKWFISKLKKENENG